MKFTKKETEFLLIALQWAEQDRETLARVYDNCPKIEQDVHVKERNKVIKLRQKVRKWLQENKGEVLLTTKTELSEMGDSQTRGWIEVIRKGKL